MSPKIYDMIFILFFVTEIPPQQMTTFPTLHLGIEWDLLNIKTFLTSRYDSVTDVIEI
jgi:hypothetical protein